MTVHPRVCGIFVLCLSLGIAGAAVDLWLLQRAALTRQRSLEDEPGKALKQPELEALLTRVAPNLPPDIRTKLAQAVLAESDRAGYDPLLILAVVGVESRFRLKVASERGARGLVQLKPSTFAWIAAREPDVGGEDADVADDPVIDVRLAVRYFRWLEHRFRTRDEALMAYNAGPKRIQQYRGRLKDIPDKFKEYPRRVKREHARLMRLLGGAQDVGTGSEVLLARVQR
jgi:soluble lytic murein transglycosylase-like protein